MTAKEVQVIQKLDNLRRAAVQEGQYQSLWANGRGYTCEADNYKAAKEITNTAYQELIALLATE